MSSVVIATPPVFVTIHSFRVRYDHFNWHQWLLATPTPASINTRQLTKNLFQKCDYMTVTYELAKLGCMEGFAVAHVHRTSSDELEIVGTFRTRRSLTAVMIASEGNIVYRGPVEDGDMVKEVEVPVTVHSYGKMASFQSCGTPIVSGKVRMSN